MEKRLTKIIVSLIILIIDLIFCTVIGNYCLSKNNYGISATTLNAKDIMIEKQLNTELLNKYDGQYIIIENYIVENLSYDKENATLGMYKENGIRFSFDDTTIYLKMQDTNKTLKHQLKKGDKITIYGKLIKSEEFKSNCCGSQGENYSLSLDDYKITNIDTSNEIKVPTATDDYYDDNPYTPNQETTLSILTKYINNDVRLYKNGSLSKKPTASTLEELKQLHKKNYPETEIQVTTSLTSAQIKQDESENYKILRQCNGKYIRITDFKYNDWYNIEEWIGDSRTEKITATVLNSNLRKSEETGSFKPTIEISLILDSSDMTTLKHLLKKNDKITIEGKLEDFQVDRDSIKLTNCRIIE